MFASVADFIRRVIYGKNKEDAKLVQKIDLLVMTYACLTQFINTLDQMNFSNAYISGSAVVEGDYAGGTQLNFKGDQYNLCNTLFVIGYTLGQVPSNIALTFIPPRIWFSAMQFSWAVFCLGQFASKNVQTVMALRFLMGLTEASTFVGMHFIFGSWYKPSEIAKRAALFTTCAQIGAILSGFIQGGLYQRMNGRGGLQGWQWLFVVDFIISMPVVIYGFLMFPDFPHNTKCRWFSEEEKRLCVARLPNVNVEKPRWLAAATWKRFLKSWPFYAFPLLFTLYGTGVQIVGNNTMAFFMKKHGISDVLKLNYYPTGMTATGCFAMWFYAILSDLLGTKVPASLAIGMTFIVSGAIALAPGVEFGGKLFAFYLAGTTLAPQSLWYAWINDLTRHDFELRTITTALMNTVMEAFLAWWPLVFFPADSPNFDKGFLSVIIIGVLTILAVLGIWMLEKKTQSSTTIQIGRPDANKTMDVDVVELGEEEPKSPSGPSGMSMAEGV